MATAPRPRSSSGEGERRVWIRIKDQEWTFDFRDFTTSDRMLVRKATGGLALESFYSGETAFGVDSIAVFTFLARRHAGETELTWKDHEAWFDVFTADVTPSDMDAEMGPDAGKRDDDSEDQHPLG